MGLIKCPACGRRVSPAAAQCPECGHPIAGRKTESTTGLSALLVVGGLCLTCWLMFVLAAEMKNTGLAVVLSMIPTAAAFVFASFRKK